MKMYKLQNTSESHTNYLSTILQTCSLASPDVCLITKEGHTVFTNKVLLVINSNMMAEVMVDNARDEMIRISVPVSSNTLINLIKILSHGITNSDIKFNPVEVLAAAEVLGMNLLNLQIGKEETNEHKKVDRDSNLMDTKIEIYENISEDQSTIDDYILKGKIVKTDEIADDEGNESMCMVIPSIEENENLDRKVDNLTGKIVDTKEVFDALQIDAENEEKLMVIPSIEENKNLGRNFPCEVCESRFQSSAGLGIHMLTHTGEKPFKCNKCEKSFNQRGHLERHSTLHTGIKPFKCEHCDKRCNRIDNLKKHKMNKHMKL